MRHNEVWRWYSLHLGTIPSAVHAMRSGSSTWMSICYNSMLWIGVHIHARKCHNENGTALPCIIWFQEKLSTKSVVASPRWSARYSFSPSRVFRYIMKCPTANAALIRNSASEVPQELDYAIIKEYLPCNVLTTYLQITKRTEAHNIVKLRLNRSGLFRTRPSPQIIIAAVYIFLISV